MEKTDFQEELEVGLEAAEKAGDIIDSYVEDGFDHWKKDDGGSVTDADIESQETIVSTIKEAFTEDGFLGEEEHLEPDGEERVWIIDPVDGTFNFKKGFGHYCVSIALQLEEETVVGIVHSPETALGKTFLAVKGEGSYVLGAGERLEEASGISVSNHSSINEGVFFSTLFDIYEGELELEQKIVGELARKGAVHRQLGSCAVEMCFIAEGRAELGFNPIMSEWDYAAAKLIIEEAGGKVRIQGSKFPDSVEVVYSNGRLHEELEEMIDNSK